MPSAESIRRNYEAVHSDRQAAADSLQRLLDALLVEVNCHHIGARAKDVGSYCTKAAKVTGEDKTPKYDDPIHQITDQVAARIITYLPETVDDVCAVLADEFCVTEDENKGEKMKREGKFGYASRHLLLKLTSDRAAQREYASLAGLEFEVQVRTVVQHAWAEFEHDVRYKYDIPADQKPEFDRSFALAAALLEMADREFTTIADLFDKLARETPSRAELSHGTVEEPSSPGNAVSPTDASKPDSEPLIRAEDLPAVLAKRYPNAARSRRDHYGTMVRVLSNLGIETVSDLDASLAEVESDAVATAMDHQLPAGHVRRLEDDLLCAFGTRYLSASDVDGLSGREGILHSRLHKIEPLRP